MAKGIAHRDWALHRSDYDSDAEFLAAVQHEQAMNVHLMERLGVAVIASPARAKWPDGSWYTQAYLFMTDSVPAAREPEPKPAPVADAADDEFAAALAGDE
jgi:hypothetical protein